MSKESARVWARVSKSAELLAWGGRAVRQELKMEPGWPDVYLYHGAWVRHVELKDIKTVHLARGPSWFQLEPEQRIWLRRLDTEGPGALLLFRHQATFGLVRGRHFTEPRDATFISEHAEYLGKDLEALMRVLLSK